VRARARGRGYNKSSSWVYAFLTGWPFTFLIKVFNLANPQAVRETPGRWLVLYAPNPRRTIAFAVVKFTGVSLIIVLIDLLIVSENSILPGPAADPGLFTFDPFMRSFNGAGVLEIFPISISHIRILIPRTKQIYLRGFC